jgi:hypothetical protein
MNAWSKPTGKPRERTVPAAKRQIDNRTVDDLVLDYFARPESLSAEHLRDVEAYFEQDGAERNRQLYAELVAQGNADEQTLRQRGLYKYLAQIEGNS